jgi:hypothetical protein
MNQKCSSSIRLFSFAKLYLQENKLTSLSTISLLKAYREFGKTFIALAFRSNDLL